MKNCAKRSKAPYNGEDSVSVGSAFSAGFAATSK